MSKFKFLKNINLLQYIYLNYFSKNINRRGNGKILPFKNTIFSFSRGSQIILYEDSLEIGTNKLRKSKAETYIRLREDAVWVVKGGADISYGSTIELLNKAQLHTGFFTMNSACVLICEREIVIGNDVMIGRGVTIYDSDFHKIRSNECNGIESSKFSPVYIGDKVWIATNATILKGVFVNEGNIISAGTLLSNSVLEKNRIIMNDKDIIISSKDVDWSR